MIILTKSISVSTCSQCEEVVAKQAKDLWTCNPRNTLFFGREIPGDGPGGRIFRKEKGGGKHRCGRAGGRREDEEQTTTPAIVDKR